MESQTITLRSDHKIRVLIGWKGTKFERKWKFLPRLCILNFAPVLNRVLVLRLELKSGCEGSSVEWEKR